MQKQVKNLSCSRKKNMKIGKGVCDIIRSKETGKKTKNSSAVEEEAFFLAVLKLLVNNEVFS